MDMLETTSTVEALAFRYAATAAGSLWAWAAVLAAAISLWRFRGAAAAAPPSPPPKPTPPPPPPSLPTTTHTPHLQLPAARTPPCHHEDGLGTLKGRFTAHFSSEDHSAAEEEEEDDGGMVAPPRGWIYWEADGVVRRRGDLGWYRYQDMAALDGSVVRLWDGGRRRV